uniref:hypothetical protein n=1 Tax=Bacillus pumilus TaxID=1408 RepID=UPI001C9310FB
MNGDEYGGGLEDIGEEWVLVFDVAVLDDELYWDVLLWLLGEYKGEWGEGVEEVGFEKGNVGYGSNDV